MRYWLQLKTFRFPLWTWLACRLERSVPKDKGFGPFHGADDSIVSQLADAKPEGTDFDPPVAVITARREEL
jgi:hypothetical protein